MMSLKMNPERHDCDNAELESSKDTLMTDIIRAIETLTRYYDMNADFTRQMLDNDIRTLEISYRKYKNLIPDNI